IDDALRSQRGVGLEKRIRLQKSHHIRIRRASRPGVGEVPGEHLRRERADGPRQAGGLLLALVAGKPEQPVFFYRSADSKTILVSLECVARYSILVVEVSVGAKCLIAVEFEDGAMDHIGA